MKPRMVWLRLVLLSVLTLSLGYVQAQTPGYIPLWLLDGSLGDSLIVQNNGNMGVGTPTPADPLEVVTRSGGNRKVGLNTTIPGIFPGGVISFSRPGDGAKAFLIGGSEDPVDDF